MRLKSALFYIGFIPFFPFLLSARHKTDKMQKQYYTALAVSFIQTITVLTALFCWAFGTYAVAELSPLALENFTFYNIFIPHYFLAVIVLSGFFVWLYYFISGIFNCKTKFNLIDKLSNRKILLKVSYILNTAILIFICIVLFWILDSDRISKEVQKPAKVYMLYDDMGFVPRWIFPFGFYQIQKTAINKWGDGSVSIEPITNASLKEALHNGEMIFLSVHGDYSSGKYTGLFHFMNETRDRFYAYGPEQIEKLGTGSHLKFIYLAQCNGGSKHEEWARIFYPAKVKTFNRISTYPEHIFWLWVKLPRIIHYNL